MMLNEIDLHPLKQNWELSVKYSLSRFGFMVVWVAQEVGNEQTFLVEFLVDFKTEMNKLFSRI